MDMRRRAGVGSVGVQGWTGSWILAPGAQVSWNFWPQMASKTGSRNFVLDNGDGLINNM
jgi:hypothetical protein